MYLGDVGVKMVRILEFRRDLHRLANLSDRYLDDEDTPLGEIIIFPGVRFERSDLEETMTNPEPLEYTDEFYEIDPDEDIPNDFKK